MTSRLHHIKFQRHSSMSSWLLSLVILAFVSNVILDSIGLITEDTLTTVELCDTKDVETTKSGDAENKIQIKHGTFLVDLLDQSKKTLNSSFAALFSELHIEVFTPPPDYV